MAKTKQDYRNAGSEYAHAAARNGRLCAAGYPVGGDAPDVSMNGSWQATAWKEGYDEVRAVYWGSTTERGIKLAIGERVRFPGEMFRLAGRDFKITAVFPMGNVGRAYCNALCEKHPSEHAVLAEVDGQIICAGMTDSGTPATYDKIGDMRVNPDGSVSTLVDNGDGSIGTYTTNCPKPETPVIHDPYAEVPIPGPAARRIPATTIAAMPAASAHALGAHISELRNMARQDRERNPARAERLTRKADALLKRWAASANTVYQSRL